MALHDRFHDHVCQECQEFWSHDDPWCGRGYETSLCPRCLREFAKQELFEFPTAEELDEELAREWADENEPQDDENEPQD